MINDKQVEFKEVFDQFFTHLSSLNRKKQPISQLEIDLAIETAAKLELLNYEIILETAEGFDDLKNWVLTMKDEGLWEKLNQNQRVFYQQMIQNEAGMHEELQSMPVVKQKNSEKMYKQTKEKYANFKDDKKNKKQKHYATHESIPKTILPLSPIK